MVLGKSVSEKRFYNDGVWGWHVGLLTSEAENVVNDKKCPMIVIIIITRIHGWTSGATIGQVKWE